MDLDNEPKDYFIYKYTFPNGKVYIGQSQLGNNRYGNPTQYSNQTVYNAMMAYPNYRKEALELTTKRFVNNREEYWIIYYDSTNPDKGYNVFKGSSDNTVRKKRRKTGKPTGLKPKAVLQYDTEGNFIAEYPSISAAVTALGKSKGSGSYISEYLNHNKLNKETVYGFVWEYKNEEDKLKYDNKENQGNPIKED